MRFKKQIAVTIGITALWLIKKILANIQKKKHEKLLQEDAKRKYKEVIVAIENSINLPEISEELSKKILQSSILKLQKGLEKKKFTCQDIFLAYTHQIRKESVKYNCIVDINIQSGFIRARKLDKELLEGKRRSNLHGIPISVKDFISVKNTLSSYGCASLSHNIMSSDAHLIRILKKKGAIIYIKSAMAQNAGYYETICAISGVTLNPYDINRSPGGSSGGDAVLVSTNGTPLGLGTDFGGSLRFPAVSCGICTLKPTSSRVSRSGPLSLQDLPRLNNSWGPLGKTPEDLLVFFQEVLSEKPSGNLPWLP